MKRLAILTSILALTACGGGSGGGHGGSTYQPEILKPENVITEDMLTQNAELAKKLQTIEYVENNLGDLESNNTISTQSVQTGRNATSNKFINMKVSDVESRYQKALKYFEVLEKVKNKSDEITIGELKIAYSLAANKPLNEITKYDLPGIDIENNSDSTKITIQTLLSNLLTNKVETNIDLKNSATQDIKNDISELASTETIDPNAALINPDLLKNLDNLDQLGDIFTDFSFKIENGQVVAVDISDDEEEPLYIKRVDNTSRFESDGDLWFFSFVAYDSGNTPHNRELGGLSKKLEGKELRNALDTQLKKKENWYSEMSEQQQSDVLDEIINNENNEWSHAQFKGDVHSLGKINGLKYSDFGYYRLDGFDFTFTYEGGINKITPANKPEAFTENMVFNGTAAGELQSNSYDNEQNELSSDNKLIVTDNGAATLTFNTDGTETMKLPFNNWYTVNIEKQGDKINTVNFTDTSKVSDDIWKLAKTSIVYPDNVTDDLNGDSKPETRGSWNENDKKIETQTTMTTNYYGKYGNVSEATGYLNHVEDIKNGDIKERQIWFSTTFGGTKQP
ncbi:MAG: hypothetical protein IKN73_02460 [Alphaproteobacteria bacterium]|nr:hypothetical protein [Alphaproteobacteria bacterium]